MAFRTQRWVEENGEISELLVAIGRGPAAGATTNNQPQPTDHGNQTKPEDAKPNATEQGQTRKEGK